MAGTLAEECLAFVRTQEGGWSDNPLDRGGPTQSGVTLATFRHWRKDDRATPGELHAIDAAEWSAIMTAGYLAAVGFESLPPGVGLSVADMAVNAGPRASIHILQAAVGVAMDGLVGPLTIAAAAAAGRPLIPALADAQRAFYRSLGQFPTFGRGWLLRTDRREAAGLAAFDAAAVEAAASADRQHAIETALAMFRSHPLSQPAAAPGFPAAPLPIEAVAPLTVKPPMVEISDVVSGGLKGAAAGAVLGPLGAGAGAAVGIAVQLVPGLTRWIAGDGGQTIDKIVSVVQSVTGTSNAAAQSAAVGDPAVAGALAVQLARIVAERERDHETATLETFKAGLGDVVSARQATLGLTAQGSATAWAAPVLSVIIVVGFVTMIVVLLRVALPLGSGPLANVLLGSLSAMALQVCNFYLGSSAGSERKTTLLANSVPATLLPAPAALVPAAAIVPASLK